MNNFDVVIGIEIHLELNTKSKMFSSSHINFDAEPNTNISPLDVAYPGSMPVVNKEAVIKAIKLAKSLNMEIDNELHFDRKHYFYPDLPKGFQITQQFRPIGKNGFLRIGNQNDVAIERIHLEEDTAKSLHKESGTFLNYNRAGVPLIEIVSMPVIKSANEAVEYVDGIRKLAKALNISDAKMEEGSLRADINISLKPSGDEKLGVKVEIKNINSLSNIAVAIEKEIEKQTEALSKGEEVAQATKRFDEKSNNTIVMRIKTGAADYKYFQEPNIPPIDISELIKSNIEIPELPWEIKERLEKLNIPGEFSKQLINDSSMLKFFDLIDFKDKSKVIKLIFSEIVPLLNKKQLDISNLNIDPNDVLLLLQKQDTGEISGSHIKKIIPLLIESNQSVDEIINNNNFKQLSDEKQLINMINEIIINNKEFISSNEDRKERVEKFILGQVMKISKGQANPIISSKLVKIVLGE